MFKWMRRLIGMVIVLFMLLVILLVPGSIPEGEQLRNVQAGSSLIELAQNAVSNASVSTEGLSTELSLNSVQLSQVVKTSAGSALENSDYQKMALGMDGNDLHVKVPVSLWPVDSYLDLTMTGQVENNVMKLTVTGAKLGKMPIPKFLVLNYLKDQSNQNGSGFTVNGDQITLEIPQAGYSISKARVENGNAKVTVSISLF
ncbi:hypothetical protein HMPREF9971_0608 [Streptococcus parasanguinis F0449]|uniref:Uncharacterized protein n=1 Tax=Streptococcus parasanguinis F0449 TaxID=1095733 RepID=I2NS52_STRPA|nr:hypothetical protein [Streptococcus parasanguinis]EIG28663.1 hypothetical protein HMPREF9971_0608 [Streptococcus parasanguinis F0449]